MPLPPEIAALLDERPIGVLATVSKSGRPRQSLVYFARQGDRLFVSTETGRWKAKDVERTGWASLVVSGTEAPYPSATVAGPATILREGAGPLTALVVQRITGAEEPPEPQSDEALAAVGRVILAIDVERVGPVSYVTPAAG